MHCLDHGYSAEYVFLEPRYLAYLGDPLWVILTMKGQEFAVSAKQTLKTVLVAPSAQSAQRRAAVAVVVTAINVQKCGVGACRGNTQNHGNIDAVFTPLSSPSLWRRYWSMLAFWTVASVVARASRESKVGRRSLGIAKKAR